MNDEITNTVLDALQDEFPAFPATVRQSPEDSLTLWVMVFSVPANQVREVKDFIHDLQDRLPMQSTVVLLPMVKNLEVTRQYYPEFIPTAKVIESYLSAITIKKWETALPCSATVYVEYSAMTSPGFCMNAWNAIKTPNHLMPSYQTVAAISTGPTYALAA